MKSFAEMKKELGWKTDKWDDSITVKFATEVDPKINIIYINANLFKNGTYIGNQSATIWNGSFLGANISTSRIIKDIRGTSIFSGGLCPILNKYNQSINAKKRFSAWSARARERYPDLQEVFDCPPIRKIIYFSLTELNSRYRRRDLGLFLKFTTMMAYGDKSTLLLNYPFPATDYSRHSTCTGADALRKHWGKIGLRAYKPHLNQDDQYFWMHLGKHRIPFK